jgi:methylated-DNA-protein-cysteine methyltransferase-like protein
MSRVDPDFKQRVNETVRNIPKGRVMTYGQIASSCGAAWAAWEVGQIAHRGPDDLPWQRVVNKRGGLAKGWPTGIQGHKLALENDGIDVREDITADVEKFIWRPA